MAGGDFGGGNFGGGDVGGDAGGPAPPYAGPIVPQPYRSLRGPPTAKGKRRERGCFAMMLAFFGFVIAGQAVFKIAHGWLPGYVVVLFACGLLRFAWALWRGNAWRRARDGEDGDADRGDTDD